MILVFGEIRDGQLKKASLEALSTARRVGETSGLKVGAVIVGSLTEETKESFQRCGADIIYCLSHPLLGSYSSSGYSNALAQLVTEENPEALLLAATAMGRDLAPRLAARLRVGLASDCVRLELKEGVFEAVRPIFAGKAFLTVQASSSPFLATLRPNVFPVVEKASSSLEVEERKVDLDEDMVKERVEEIIRGEQEELDITEAEIVISGGRGMKGAENFQLLRELSALLPQAAIGASRSAVDAGWIDHQHQVGQTGKTVSPTLYMAFGISGAIQHLAGMSSSKYIVAVNKDPEAPIFKVADFGVVGDLFEVIPHLKEELKKFKS